MTLNVIIIKNIYIVMNRRSLLMYKHKLAVVSVFVFYVIYFDSSFYAEIN